MNGPAISCILFVGPKESGLFVKSFRVDLARFLKMLDSERRKVLLSLWLYGFKYSVSSNIVRNASSTNEFVTLLWSIWPEFDADYVHVLLCKSIFERLSRRYLLVQPRTSTLHGMECCERSFVWISPGRRG